MVGGVVGRAVGRAFRGAVGQFGEKESIPNPLARTGGRDIPIGALGFIFISAAPDPSDMVVCWSSSRGDNFRLRYLRV